MQKFTNFTIFMASLFITGLVIASFAASFT